MKLVLVLFLSVFTLSGQNIKGTILDSETNKPLAQVNVYFKKGNAGTVSNDKGQFTLKLRSKIRLADSVRFSIIGYQPRTFTYSILKKANFVVYLSKKTENLKEITVSSKRSLKTHLPFQKLSPLKKGLFAFGATLADNKIYVIGGEESLIVDGAKRTLDVVSNIPESSFADFLKESRTNFSWELYSNKLQTYDIDKNAWTISDKKFRKRAYHHIVSVDKKIYVLGGKTLSTNRKLEYLENKIEVLDLNTKEIDIDNTNPHQAINFAAVPYQDNIITLGGSVKLKNNGEKIYTDKSYIYNTTSGFWYELAKMTRPKEVNGILVNNKIYLVGGFNRVPLKEIESYDLITGKWKNEGDLFYGIESPALTHHENVIYIFNDGIILTYNVDTHTLNEYKIGLELKKSQIHYYKNHLYILGGHTEDEYTKAPSDGLYSINLNEFLHTEIVKSRTMDSTPIIDE